MDTPEGTNPLDLTREQRIEWFKNYPDPKVGLELFLHRCRHRGWTVERALSTPAYQSRGLSKQCMEFYSAQEHNPHGVQFDTFYNRVQRGWSMTDAFYTPLKTIDEVARQYYYKHPKPAVPFNAYCRRIQHNGWSMADAVSKPPRKTAKAPTRWCGPRKFYEENKHRAAVDFQVFNARIKRKIWDMESALTAPLQPSGVRRNTMREFYNNHPNPAVSYRTFASRVRQLRWTKEQAILSPSVNAPVNVKDPKRLAINQARDHYNKHKDVAVVDLKTFLKRVTEGNWSYANALFTPKKKTATSEVTYETDHLEIVFRNFARCSPDQRASL